MRFSHNVSQFRFQVVTLLTIFVAVKANFGFAVDFAHLGDQIVQFNFFIFRQRFVSNLKCQIQFVQQNLLTSAHTAAKRNVIVQKLFFSRFNFRAKIAIFTVRTRKYNKIRIFEQTSFNCRRVSSVKLVESNCEAISKASAEYLDNWKRTNNASHRQQKFFQSGSFLLQVDNSKQFGSFHR